MNKSWYQSRGVWGAIVLVLIGVIEAVPIVGSGDWASLPEALGTISLGLMGLGIRLAIPGG